MHTTEKEETKMVSRARVAMTISGDKARHPERYCPARRCLWKTAEVGPDGKYILNADPCRKHHWEVLNSATQDSFMRKTLRPQSRNQ